MRLKYSGLYNPMLLLFVNFNIKYCNAIIIYKQADLEQLVTSYLY